MNLQLRSDLYHTQQAECEELKTICPPVTAYQDARVYLQEQCNQIKN
jgi:hypothetical protein